MAHRGRFQAQGQGTEKSEPWASMLIPTKVLGIELVDSLQLQLTRRELRIRVKQLQKARDFVNSAPIQGYEAVISKQYRNFEFNDVRIDVEIWAGVAFRP